MVCCYVALVITNFAWLFPVLTGHADLAVDLEHGDLAAQLAVTAAPLIRVWGGPSAGSYDETASRVAQSRDPLLCTAMVALWSEHANRVCCPGLAGTPIPQPPGVTPIARL